MTHHERISPPDLPAPSGYAHALRARDMVFLSGQVALDEARTLVGPGDMEAQARQVFKNLTTLLRAVGLDWPDVAKLNIYLTDMDGIEAVRRVRSDVFSSAAMLPPAITTVGVTRLAVAGALIEVEALAVPRAAPEG